MAFDLAGLRLASVGAGKTSAGASPAPNVWTYKTSDNIATVDDVDSATVTAGGTVAIGSVITLVSDGGGTAGAGHALVLIQP